jgi:hypothetical protein
VLGIQEINKHERAYRPGGANAKRAGLAYFILDLDR